MNSRGHTGGFHILVFAAVSLIVVSVVLTAGMSVASELGANINQTNFAAAENQTTTPGPYYNYPLWPPLVLIVVAVVFVGYLNQNPGKTGTGSDPTTDQLTLVKEQYVEGDIETTVKLEKELQDYLDPDVDDSAIDELDDLLGDDTE